MKVLSLAAALALCTLSVTTAAPMHGPEGGKPYKRQEQADATTTTAELATKIALLPAEAIVNAIAELHADFAIIERPERLAPEGTETERLAPEGTETERLAPEGTEVERLAPEDTEVEHLAPRRLVPEEVDIDRLPPHRNRVSKNPKAWYIWYLEPRRLAPEETEARILSPPRLKPLPVAPRHEKEALMRSPRKDTLAQHLAPRDLEAGEVALDATADELVSKITKQVEAAMVKHCPVEPEKGYDMVCLSTNAEAIVATFGEQVQDDIEELFGEAEEALATTIDALNIGGDGVPRHKPGRPLTPPPYVQEPAASRLEKRKPRAWHYLRNLAEKRGVPLPLKRDHPNESRLQKRKPRAWHYLRNLTEKRGVPLPLKRDLSNESRLEKRRPRWWDGRRSLVEKRSLPSRIRLLKRQELATMDLTPEEELATMDLEKRQELATMDLTPEEELATMDLEKRQELATMDLEKRQELATMDLEKRQELATMDLEKRQELATMDLTPEEELATMDLEKRQELATMDVTPAPAEELATKDVKQIESVQTRLQEVGLALLDDLQEIALPKAIALLRALA